MLEILKNNNIFSSFNEKQLKILIKLGEKKIIEANEPLFNENSTTNALYLVVGGKLKGSYNNITKEFKKGDILSELSLFINKKHKIKVLAMQKSKVFILEKKQIEKLKEKSPKFVLKLQNNVFENFINKIESIEEKFL